MMHYTDDIGYLTKFCNDNYPSAEKDMIKFDMDEYRRCIAQKATAEKVKIEIQKNPFKDPLDILEDLESAYSMEIIACRQPITHSYFQNCIDAIGDMIKTLRRRRGYEY